MEQRPSVVHEFVEEIDFFIFLIWSFDNKVPKQKNQKEEKLLSFSQDI